MTVTPQQAGLHENSQILLEEKFDYIITGAGCAGLSLVMHIIATGKLGDKRILLVDKDVKNTNDRTWCFWEDENRLFQTVVYKEWKQLQFKSVQFDKALIIGPYTYKLIRGIDFYNYCLEEIKKHPNIYFKRGTVESITSNSRETYVKIDGQKLSSKYIFNSIIFQKPQLHRKHSWLLQHFKGWFIETGNDHFNPEAATLMDFNTNQSKGAAFFYVLPFSKTRALVEYTLFSPGLLTDGEYEMALEHYVQHTLQISSYTILEKEFGTIPMTNYRFASSNNNIINIGTAGGQTKASSGYTFRFIQKQSEAITAKLVNGDYPLPEPASKRFHFYDSILLRILSEGKLDGREIFKRLFERNKAAKVLKFLDNDTSLGEEVSIISSLPTLPFLKAAVKQVVTFS